MRLLQGLLFLIAINSHSSWANEPWKFPDLTSHCVAWKTEKRMFLVSTVNPVGINCKFNSKIVTGERGRSLELRVPIEGFESGEPERDKEVLKILKAEVQPELVIRTEDLGAEGADKLFGKEKSELSAELTIGGKKFTIPKVSYQIEVREGVKFLVGHVSTTFSAFDIEPPAVAGGLVAKVQDVLELHYQIRKDRIQ